MYDIICPACSEPMYIYTRDELPVLGERLDTENYREADGTPVVDGVKVKDCTNCGHYLIFDNDYYIKRGDTQWTQP